MFVKHPWLLAISLATLIAAGSVWAATPPVPTASAPRPATPPASAPMPMLAVTLDFSTPAATTTTFLTALNHGDFSAVRKSLDIPAPHAASVDALLATMEASAQLQQAASARYLSAGEKAFGKPSSALLADQLKALASAPLAINGATATLTLPTDAASQLPGGTVEFKKIGSDWKIDAAAFFKLNTEPAAKTAERVALAQKITAISKTLTTEIAAGKYFSATDAYQEYWTRCQEASQPPTPPTSTTTPMTSPKP